MYERFFGLRERPFELTPNPRFLYFTPRHREALVNLEFGIESRKGVVVLIGEAGMGKTTVTRAVIEKQRGREVKCIYCTTRSSREPSSWSFSRGRLN